MQQNYQIGSFSLALDSDFTFLESETADMFRIDRPGRHLCVCRTVERLPISPGKEIYRDDRHVVWRVDGHIELTTDTQLPQRHPYILSVEYGEDKPTKLFYNSADLSWSARAGYFWRALGLRHRLILAGSVLVHASFAELDGKGILFVLPPGGDKALPAAILAKQTGARIINGGRAVVWMEGSTPMVCGAPISGSSLICRNARLPIKAIVSVKSGAAGPLTGSAAAAAIFRNVATDTWRDGEFAAALSIMAEIIARVPVIGLGEKSDEQAIKRLTAMLEADA